MIFDIIKKDIKEKKLSLIIYCLTGIFLVWLYISIYPSMAKQAADFEKLIAAFPKDFLKAFGFQGSYLENAESLLSTELFGLIWPIMTVILLLSRVAGGIAGEIESGTIGTLLSQPISRTKIFLAKYLSAVTTLVVFVSTTVLINIPLLAAYKLEFSVKYELLFALVCLLFGLAIIGAGIAVSAMSNEKSKVYGIVGGLIVLMFIVNIISGLKSDFDFLKYTSIFYYFSSYHIIVRHEINMVAVAIFSSIAFAGMLFGLTMFNKRDIQA